MTRVEREVKELKRKLDKLPKGTLTYKTIKGKKQPYLQRSINGRSVSYYVKASEREQILMEIEERDHIQEEISRLLAYEARIQSILKTNPYLNRVAGIGQQDFADLMRQEALYVDKTKFIAQWWESNKQATLVTRPRRFGKTLFLSTIEHFFSVRFSEDKKYFKNLAVWDSEKTKKAQGQYPVVFISLAGIKDADMDAAIRNMGHTIQFLYNNHEDLLDSTVLSEDDKKLFRDMAQRLYKGDLDAINTGLKFLMSLLYKHYGKKVIFLLDEYDTPLQEAYVSGYWDQMIRFYSNWLNNTVKTNEFIERSFITGITRITKNALFSDMNHLSSYSVLNDEYGECFGFTQGEVMDILTCYDNADMEQVRQWYDGFTFGKTQNMYNPWSIVNFIEAREFRPYWINTSSNELIGQLMRKHEIPVKDQLEQLLEGQTIRKTIREDLALQYLENDEDTFWALLLATGYIKAENIQLIDGDTIADLKITNKECLIMFRQQIIQMFARHGQDYNEFTRALLFGCKEELEDALNRIVYSSISYFDSGSGIPGKIPENFFHGLVLGMVVSLRDEYRVVSNRESGYGRYDIMLIPFDKTKKALIFEFKVKRDKKEDNLEETAQNALKQIRDMDYKAELVDQGFQEDQIRMLGFGFSGKKAYVLEK